MPGLQVRPWELVPVDVDADDPIPGGDDHRREGRAIRKRLRQQCQRE
jgi:hypothetical protein